MRLSSALWKISEKVVKGSQQEHTGEVQTTTLYSCAEANTAIIARIASISVRSTAMRGENNLLLFFGENIGRGILRFESANLLSLLLVFRPYKWLDILKAGERTYLNAVRLASQSMMSRGKATMTRY